MNAVCAQSYMMNMLIMSQQNKKGRRRSVSSNGSQNKVGKGVTGVAKGAPNGGVNGVVKANGEKGENEKKSHTLIKGKKPQM